MKKSKYIILGGVIIASIALHSCTNSPDYEDQWLSVDGNADTIVNYQNYRQYNGYWYPVYHNQINPGAYRGYLLSTIKSSSFKQEIIPVSDRIPVGGLQHTSSSSGGHSYGGGHSGGFGGSFHGGGHSGG